MISQVSAFITLLAIISTFVAAIDDTTTLHEDPFLELYMHDVLGGSNPTARTITDSGNINSGQVPFARPMGLRLGYGTITVIDDVLRSGPGLGSQPIGKAHGVYVASSGMMAFSAMIQRGGYGDSLNFFGVYKIGSTVSMLSVTGGTGKFRNVFGFAEVRPLVSPGPHVADGAEALLRITVHLTY